MKKSILVFPCGSEIGLEIHRSFQYSKDFELYGASSVDDHGKYEYTNYIDGVPFVDDQNFVEKINDVIERYNIDLIFPAHDSVVLKLAENAEDIKARVVTSSAETARICRSKAATYNRLKNVIATPHHYQNEDNLDFPVFVKPDVGQGSKGAMKIDNKDQLDGALKKDSSLIVLEYLPGEEYTVDCFTDKSNELLYAAGRSRSRTSNGISVNSKFVNDPIFRQIAEKINDQLSMRGVWFFQVKLGSRGEYALLEVAPRVAGTMALSRMRGVNLPLLAAYDALDIDVSITTNAFTVEIDRALSARYSLGIDYDTVYVDFDDTLIIQEKVNEKVLAFLYKCMNESKRIILLTKHVKEVLDTLNEYRICPDIFDEIIRVERDEQKAGYITNPERSIFIDDSFAERKYILQATGIPVFDVSEIAELV